MANVSWNWCKISGEQQDMCAVDSVILLEAIKKPDWI